MVQGILVEVTLSADEDVVKEAPKVLAELNYIEELHLKGRLGKRKPILWKRLRDTLPSKPTRQILYPLQYLERPG